MDSKYRAAVRKIESANDIAPDCGLLVVFAPVDIRSARAAGTVENMGGSDPFELFHYSFTVFHPDGCHRNNLALTLEKLVQMSCNPSIAAPDQERLGSLIRGFESGRGMTTQGFVLPADHLEESSNGKFGTTRGLKEGETGRLEKVDFEDLLTSCKGCWICQARESCHETCLHEPPALWHVLVAVSSLYLTYYNTALDARCIRSRRHDVERAQENFPPRIRDLHLVLVSTEQEIEKPGGLVE